MTRYVSYVHNNGSMHDVNRDMLIREIMRYPVMEYAFLPSAEVPFSDRVRWVCEHECERYGSTWSCPPAVGTFETCRKRCVSFSDVFVFSTVAEIDDIMDLKNTLKTRLEHEEITRGITWIFRKCFGNPETPVYPLVRDRKPDILTLSTESCDICGKCSWPDRPCRHPERMFPCVESHGVLVPDLCDSCGMQFDNGTNVATWFSMIFFNGGMSGINYRETI